MESEQEKRAEILAALRDYTQGKSKIRGCFEHGLSNASDTLLSKANNLVEAVIHALEFNDAKRSQ